MPRRVVVITRVLVSCFRPAMAGVSRVCSSLRFATASLLLLLTMAFASAQDGRTYTGAYRNVEYGYSIAIPGGRVCRGAAAPAPAHGCRIAGGEDGADVDVWARYHTEEGGAAELLDNAVGDLRREFGDTAVVARERFRLRGLEALRATVRWKRDGRAGIDRIVVAIRRRPNSPLEIVYSIRGRCPDGAAEECAALFADVVRSFRLHPPR